MPATNDWVICGEHVLGFAPRSIPLDDAGDDHLADSYRLHSSISSLTRSWLLAGCLVLAGISPHAISLPLARCGPIAARASSPPRPANPSRHNVVAAPDHA